MHVSPGTGDASLPASVMHNQYDLLARSKTYEVGAAQLHAVSVGQ